MNSVSLQASYPGTEEAEKHERYVNTHSGQSRRGVITSTEATTAWFTVHTKVGIQGSKG